jgi:hypothetical protein
MSPCPPHAGLRERGAPIAGAASVVPFLVAAGGPA